MAEIAAIVCRSRNTIERVLKSFLRGGVLALPQCKAPRMTLTVTPEWKAELRRVIELAPHTVSVPVPIGPMACWRPIWRLRPT